MVTMLVPLQLTDEGEAATERAAGELTGGAGDAPQLTVTVVDPCALPALAIIPAVPPKLAGAV
jgi:hypothetical protein